MQESNRTKYVNVDRIQRTVEQGPYDAVIVMSPENIPYYSGFYNIDLRLLPERIHLVIWPKRGEPVFVVIDRRANAFRPGDTFLTDIVTYEGEEYDSMRAVADVLAEKGTRIRNDRHRRPPVFVPASARTSITRAQGPSSSMRSTSSSRFAWSRRQQRSTSLPESIAGQPNRLTLRLGRRKPATPNGRSRRRCNTSY